MNQQNIEFVINCLRQPPEAKAENDFSVSFFYKTKSEKEHVYIQTKVLNQLNIKHIESIGMGEGRLINRISVRNIYGGISTLDLIYVKKII